jgi:hypothetical protein
VRWLVKGKVNNTTRSVGQVSALRLPGYYSTYYVEILGTHRARDPYGIVVSLGFERAILKYPPEFSGVKERVPRNHIDASCRHRHLLTSNDACGIRHYLALNTIRSVGVTLALGSF